MDEDLVLLAPAGDQLEGRRPTRKEALAAGRRGRAASADDDRRDGDVDLVHAPRLEERGVDFASALHEKPRYPALRKPFQQLRDGNASLAQPDYLREPLHAEQ